MNAHSLTILLFFNLLILLTTQSIHFTLKVQKCQKIKMKLLKKIFGCQLSLVVYLK